jgi:hypothetical protein
LENYSRKSFNCFRYHLLIFFSFLLVIFYSGCGLPSSQTTVLPPTILSSVDKHFVFRVYESQGFVLYYKAVDTGTGKVNEDFINNVTATGLAVFTNRNYSAALAENKTTASINYIWTADPTTSFPIEVDVSYDNSELTVTVTDNTGVVFNTKVIRNNKENFSSPLSSGSDLNGITGPANLAFATMAFKIDPTTLTLYPSVGVHIGYINNITIQ